MTARSTTTDIDSNDALPLPDGRWVLDPGRSTATFAAKGTWGLIPVKGAFERLRGELEIVDGAARGTLALDAASLETGSAQRDKHLRSADFFDVERHPEVVFLLRALRGRPGGGASAEGILEVRDVTHPLTLDLTVAQLGRGDVRLTTATRVERADVGLTWNKLGMMRGDVALSVSAVLVRG